MAKEEKKDNYKKNNTKSKNTSAKTKTNNNNNNKKSVTEKNSVKERDNKNSTKRKNYKDEEVKIKQLSFDEVEEEVKEEKKETKKTVKKNKTGDILLVAGLIVVIIVGLIVLGGEKPKPSYTLPLELKGDAGFHLLSYKEYQDKIDNNESFVVVLSRESCGHCANFLPVAKKYAEDKKVPMYYIDTDTFKEEEWTTFEKSNSFLKEKNGNWGTPTTVVLAGSEAVDYIEGETTADKLEDLYKKYFK